MLENGNILFHENWTTILEMTLDKKIVWTYDSAKMNGNQGKRVEVHAFQRLPNGLTMIAESGVGRIIEVDKDGKLKTEVKLRPGGTQNTRMARKLDNGNYLVCAENPGVVNEYNAKGDAVWEYPIKTRVYGAIRLRNGNTLIASGGGAGVVEVTPDRKVVWEIKDSVPDTKIALKWTTSLMELGNGNFIVGNCHAGEKSPQIFEITRDKKVVWQFNQFETFGNGLACSQVLNDTQSLSPSCQDAGKKAFNAFRLAIEVLLLFYQQLDFESGDPSHVTHQLANPCRRRTGPEWHEPFPAHKIVGNVYYVGSKDLATYMITSTDGHILINSGFDRTVPLIQKSVESLGFKMSDVKILLASHAHNDHVAGHALLQKITGAKVHVMQGDDQVIASGGKEYKYTTGWTPCKVDRVLEAGTKSS